MTCCWLVAGDVTISFNPQISAIEFSQSIVLEKDIYCFLLFGHAYHQLPIPSHLRSTVTRSDLSTVAVFGVQLALQSHQ